MLPVKPIGQETRRRQRETTKRPSEKNKERKRERGFSIDRVEQIWWTQNTYGEAM